VPGAGAVIAAACTLDYGKPGKPPIDWDDPAAKQALVSDLVNDALAVLEALTGPGAPERDTAAADALGLLAVGFKLDAIASIGSAVALLIFTLITAAHFRVRSETGASAFVLSLAIASAGIVLVVFVFTTLIHEPASIATLAGIIVLGVVLDLWWKRARAGRADQVRAVH
jgi:hypothetical protein